MQRFMSLAALCLSVLLMSGCSLPRGAALSSEILREKQQENPSFQVVEVTRDNVNVIKEWPATGWKGSYRWINAQRGPQSPIIRSGDQLSLVIWDSQENSLLISSAAKQANLDNLAVSTQGEVFIPYLGAVQVQNMTPDAAREKIQAALEPIIPSAQVQLSLQAGLRNSVDLVGGVVRPGSYPLPNRNYTIISLLAKGGGILPNLRNPVVRLTRSSNSYEILVERLMSEPQLNTTLRGDDKVVVEEDQRFFTALGATGREELVYFEREHITAMEALSTIGGLSDGRANLKSVLVLRDYPAAALHKNAAGPNMQQVIFAFDLTTADGLFAARTFGINPQDTVFATEAVVTSARTVLGLIGSVVGVSNAVNNVTN